MRLLKTFAKGLSSNIKWSKAHLSKIWQSRGFLGRILGRLLKTGLPLIKNTIKPLAKKASMPLRLKVSASATDATIQKKIFGSGTTKLIISNEEMNDIMIIIKSLEDADLLIKGISETIENEANEQKGGFLGMLLGTLGASLLWNLLPVGAVIWAGKQQSVLVKAKLELLRIFNDIFRSFNQFENTNIFSKWA